MLITENFESKNSITMPNEGSAPNGKSAIQGSYIASEFEDYTANNNKNTEFKKSNFSKLDRKVDP